MAWQRKIPFGYQMHGGEIQLHPQEAETVRTIFTRYLAGASLLTIAESLTKHGPRYHEHTPEWNKHMVKRILENPKYIGGQGHPQIVSDEDFLAVQLRKADCTRPVSRSAEIVPVLDKMVCAMCGSPMRRDTRTHGRPRWQCQNPDCRQTVFISDEALSGQVAQRLRELAQVPHLLPVPPVNQAVPSTDTVRLQNELTLALNRNSESPEYIKALALAAAAQRYDQLTDPTPAYEFQQLLTRTETSPDDADTLADLLSMAVQSVRLKPDKTIELELTNSQIITDTEEAHSA